ncbi:MAG: sigma-70 family RNA polymerase sigma factor [Bacteroidota bacterium]
MDFDRIYKKYYTELYCFATRQNLLHTEASDLAQDVFTEFYMKLKSGNNIENPRAWLYKVLLNSIRSKYRINKARVEKDTEIASYTQSSTDPNDNFHINERRKIVEKCISQLSADDQNLLLLYHKGFSYKEISEILNIGYTSVGTYIARATKKLKLILITQYHEMFE